MQVGNDLRRAVPRNRPEQNGFDLAEHRRLGREWADDLGARWLISADAAIRHAALAISRWFGRA